MQTSGVYVILSSPGTRSDNFRVVFFLNIDAKVHF